MKRILTVILACLFIALPALASVEDAQRHADAFAGALGRRYRLTELYYDGNDGGEYAAAGVSGLKDTAATFAWRAEEGIPVCALLVETGAADHGALPEKLLAAPEEYAEVMALLTAFAASLAPEEDAEALVARALDRAVRSGGDPAYAFFGGTAVTGGAEAPDAVAAGGWEFGIYVTLDLLVFSARPAE